MQYQSGVGMVEILVSLFVLTVGLLGVASLQFTGTFNNVQASSRSHAELVARQISEQLVGALEPSESDDGWEVDDAFFNADFYNFATLSCQTTGGLYQCHCLDLPASIPNCRTDECDTAEFAEFAGWDASCQAVRSNPNMRILVDCNDRDSGDTKACSTGSIIEISVSWPEKASQGAEITSDSRCEFDDDTQRACVVKELAL